MTVQINFKRGGRDLNNRSFSLEECRNNTFGSITADVTQHMGSMSEYDVFVRQEDSDTEIAAHNSESDTLEDVLRKASNDGNISGKSFVIDCTVEHVGAKKQ